jgi:hypothetical protein
MLLLLSLTLPLLLPLLPPPPLLLLVQSMAIDKQTAALKEAITAPLLKAKDLLVKDIRAHDELLDEPE